MALLRNSISSHLRKKKIEFIVVRIFSHINTFPTQPITNFYNKSSPRPKNFIFLFFWYAQQQNPYKLLKKPMFLFWFSPCCCIGFISKVATTKNRQFIYDLSMLYLGFEAQ
jgi:hypothetical protein